MSIRQEKFSKLIQKELATVFSEHKSAISGPAFITISNVTVSPDLGHAKVFLSIFQTDHKDQVLSSVQAQTKQIRHLLAARIRKQVRVIPELIFVQDESLDYVFRMEQVFSELKKKDNEQAD